MSKRVSLDDVLGYFYDLHQSCCSPGNYSSLGRMERLMADLGNPHKRLPPVIHVAGTNGKGSTIAFMASLLQVLGMRVHTYTSPHLIRFTERISLNGRTISEDELTEYLEIIKKVNQDQPLTFFEALTAAAFLAYGDHPADVVLVETGIGGRFDATNVIPNPFLCVLTALSYDHQHYLGDRLEEIVFEKMGIIKPGAKVVIAPQEYPVENQMIRGIKERGGHLVPLEEASECSLGLTGAFQIQNARSAVTAIRAFLGQRWDSSSVHKGLAQARWPGRLQQIREDVWLDGAHNEGAFRQLSSQMALWQEQDNKPLEVYFAMMADRDPQLVLTCLSKPVKKVYAVDMGACDTGSVPFHKPFHSAHKIAEILLRNGLSCEILPFHLLLEKLFFHQGEDASRKLITGSLHFVGRVLFAEPK
jgi:dihydrofolate synthase/folylpolyglutamate synthase